MANKKTNKKVVSAPKKVVEKVKKVLPAEVKTMNKKLTEKQNALNQLRIQKKAGKDVKKEIKEALKFLAINREKKKELLKTLN